MASAMADRNALNRVESSIRDSWNLIKAPSDDRVLQTDVQANAIVTDLKRIVEDCETHKYKGWLWEDSSLADRVHYFMTKFKSDGTINGRTTVDIPDADAEQQLLLLTRDIAVAVRTLAGVQDDAESKPTTVLENMHCVNLELSHMATTLKSTPAVISKHGNFEHLPLSSKVAAVCDSQFTHEMRSVTYQLYGTVWPTSDSHKLPDGVSDLEILNMIKEQVDEVAENVYTAPPNAASLGANKYWESDRLADHVKGYVHLAQRAQGEYDQVKMKLENVMERIKNLEEWFEAETAIMARGPARDRFVEFQQKVVPRDGESWDSKMMTDAGTNGETQGPNRKGDAMRGPI
jgi:hypothetical protein